MFPKILWNKWEYLQFRANKTKMCFVQKIQWLKFTKVKETNE